jgi:hypothetical protein
MKANWEGPCLGLTGRKSEELSARNQLSEQERRLAQLNRMYASLLSDELAEPSRSDFFKAFREQAYPEVYPDPADASHVFEAVLESASLTEDLKLAIAELQATYHASHTAISDQMERCARLWYEESVEHNRGYSVSEREQYRAKLADMQQQRFANSLQTLDLLSEQLKEMNDPKLDRVVQAFRESAKSHKSNASSQYFRP